MYLLTENYQFAVDSRKTRKPLFWVHLDTPWSDDDRCGGAETKRLGGRLVVTVNGKSLKRSDLIVANSRIGIPLRQKTFARTRKVHIVQLRIERCRKSKLSIFGEPLHAYDLSKGKVKIQITFHGSCASWNPERLSQKSILKKNFWIVDEKNGKSSFWEPASRDKQGNCVYVYKPTKNKLTTPVPVDFWWPNATRRPPRK